MEKPEHVSGLIHMGNDDMMTLRESEAIYYSEIFANCVVYYCFQTVPYLRSWIWYRLATMKNDLAKALLLMLQTLVWLHCICSNNWM